MQEGCMLVSVPYHPHAINLFKFSNPVFGIFRIFSELWRRIPDYEGVQYLYILQGAVITPPPSSPPRKIYFISLTRCIACYPLFVAWHA